MRDAYHQRLDVLVLQLARMCDLVGTAMSRATTALLDNDLGLADQVVADDVHVDEARTRVEHDAQVLLALESPVAMELRTIVTAMRSAEKVERMGDLAHHVALAVGRRHPAPVLPLALRPRFEQMGDIAVRLATTAGKILRNRDLALARTLTTADDEMDDLHRSLFFVIGYEEWNYGVVTAVDAGLLSRYYERFADHAVSVARGNAFVLTGNHEPVASILQPVEPDFG